MSAAKIILNRADAKIGTALFLLFTTAFGQANQNTATDFVIHTKKNDRLPRLQTALPRYVQVFGLFIQATERVPDSKLLHAADIAADFLDNDRDGKPDNPAVNDELWKNRAAVVMGYNEWELERLHDRYGELFDAYALQGLFATETLPDAGPHAPNSSEFDASIEEILHIITSVGYAGVYPEVFGERKGSALANLMDTARGGYFRSVPRRYPVQAWYTYDDRSCDYGCQITEYVYWALTSLLDGQDFKNRGLDISHEWKLNTPEKLRTNNKAVVKILTKPEYKLPARLPDGKYRINRKRAAVRLNIVPFEGRLAIKTKLPPGSTASLETSTNLSTWTLSTQLPLGENHVDHPVSVQRNQMHFFRIRFDE